MRNKYKILIGSMIPIIFVISYLIIVGVVQLIVSSDAKNLGILLVAMSLFPFSFSGCSHLIGIDCIFLDIIFWAILGGAITCIILATKKKHPIIYKSMIGGIVVFLIYLTINSLYLLQLLQQLMLNDSIVYRIFLFDGSQRFFTIYLLYAMFFGFILSYVLLKLFARWKK